MKNIIIANITWNPSGWRSVYTNHKAGHRYASKYPGHESLNFKFDKKNIDTRELVYGFVQISVNPPFFSNDGLIIFYTKNIETDWGNIVGVYGKAKFVEKKEFPLEGFKDNIYSNNLEANKNYSILFPIPLNAEKYKENGKRLVPQVGFTYLNEDTAKNIILDEIIELKKNNGLHLEYNILKNIYEYYFEKLEDSYIDIDEIEQNEIIEINKIKNKKELLDGIIDNENELIEINGKSYKRSNSDIANIKLLRGFKCQICGYSIPGKNGNPYIEAAHIKQKSKGGKELLNNIILMCPNHHKEFDLGKTEIIYQNDDIIEFIMNKNEYEIELAVK